MAAPDRRAATHSGDDRRGSSIAKAIVRSGTYVFQCSSSGSVGRTAVALRRAEAALGAAFPLNASHQADRGSCNRTHAVCRRAYQAVCSDQRRGEPILNTQRKS